MVKRWYAVHTKTGYENKVKQNIENQVLRDYDKYGTLIGDVLIPTQIVTEKKDGGRVVETEQKIFPGYVLVNMERNEDTIVFVRHTPGVTGFVGGGGEPIALTKDEITRIIKPNSAKPVKKITTNLEVGQNVKIVNGPLADFGGVVAEVNPEAGKVRVLVTLFGRETPVDLTFEQVVKD